MAVRDVIQSAAGSAGDSKTYIEDVFSTYLYTGNGSTQTINNGIDLAGKGGMVWIKSRSNANSNFVVDTVRGNQNPLFTNLTDGQASGISTAVTSFNSTGFSLGVDNQLDMVNVNARTYASWTFRKAPKFFDVVTYTGNGGGYTRRINHSLGVKPGMVVIKCTSGTGAWHTMATLSDGTQITGSGSSNPFGLNATNGYSASVLAGYDTAVSDTSFSPEVIGGFDGSATNASGATYVAYLFAHDTSTDGLIQCGSYTGNGSATGPVINLGWEPQYLLVKGATGNASNWFVIDNMRGMSVGSNDPTLNPNTSNAESAVNYVSPTATGFQLVTTETAINTSGNTYIYMAIRRGPMRTPTDPTKVFAPNAYSGDGTSGRSLTTLSSIDASIIKWRASSPYSDGWSWSDRLRGIRQLTSNGADAETSYTDHLSQFGPNQNTVLLGNGGTVNGSGITYIQYAFRRSPGFFDVVCYTGTGVARTVNHNLGVAPELIIIKSRSAAQGWFGYHSSLGVDGRFALHSNEAAVLNTTFWQSTAPTKTNFHIGGGFAALNASGSTYVAYLFASCPGVSKVGSYTGNGTNQTINCGFSAGARFVLIKRTDSTGDWYVWDTARGIVAGNDRHLSLNTTAAEVTTDDTIDPDSTGFIVNQVAATNVNVASATYIYLAIA